MQKTTFLLLSAIFCCLLSCSSYQDFKKYNYFNGARLYNDTLNFTIKFPGDIYFKSDFNPRKIKKEVKGIPQLKKALPLAYGNTNMSPYYQVILFFKEENKKRNNENSPKIKLLVEDSIHHQILYQSDFGDKSIYLFVKSNTKSKSMKSEKIDGKNIIESAKFDYSVREELGYWDVFNRYQNENNILFVKEKIEKAPIKETQENEWQKQQILLTLLSRDPSSEEFKKLIKKPKKKAYQQSLIDKAIKNKEGVYISKTKTFQKLKNIAKNERVFMLNESHWMPNNRVLAAQLLPLLKEAGFQYLAVEAVYKDKDHTLNERKIPLNTTGYYVREPYFGLFLRKAKELGFEIISYDQFDTENRELTQAENIYEIIEKDSEAKIFVYAGFSHVFENEPQTEHEYKRMAAYFKDISGINPITIDQTNLLGKTKEKIILFETEYFPNDEKIKKNTDYFLLNNMTPNLFEFYPEVEKQRIRLEIPELLQYKNQEVFISVYIAEEYEKYKNYYSIPIKNKIYQVKNDKINLFLPKEDFYIKIQDKNKDLIFLEKITKK